jgi:hypothetical protein
MISIKYIHVFMCSGTVPSIAVKGLNNTKEITRSCRKN